MGKWRKNKRISQKGSILIEGMVSVFAILLSSLFLIEIERLSQMHIAIEQAAFIYVRERAYGSSATKAKEKTFAFLSSFFGHEFRYPIDFQENKTESDGIGKVHIRYPQFIGFYINGNNKHHLEVTKVCHFPG